VRAIADAYLAFLYSKPAQRIGARHHYRPSDPEIAAETRFAEIPLLTVDEAFGSWDAAHAEHFAPGGVFDQIMAERR
jgi:sulfate transport system substrate-binding protein